MSLNGIDKELILSILCRDQSQFTGTGGEDGHDHQASEVEVAFISGKTTYQLMDTLKGMGVDIHQIASIICELWTIGNIDAAYLLLVLCYIVSEVELPEGALPPLTATDLVESRVYNACQDMTEYLQESDEAEQPDNESLEPAEPRPERV